jgi:multiple sugar transport system permease protein
MPDANMNSVQDSINDSIYMAGIIITISPLLLFYFVLQHWFVEGIDKAGLTGQ